jgi:uncharacterized protein with HEPN domain
MLSDTERDALEDIRDNIARAMRFVDGFDLDAFLADDKKERFPEIPWKEIAGAGSIYRHSYENVVEHRIWKTIHESLPPLRAVVDAELRESDPCGGLANSKLQNKKSPMLSVGLSWRGF